MRQLTAKFQKLSLTSRLCLLMSVIFVLSLIPLLHIGLYNHPAGDDFASGLLTHLAWKETHSLIETIKAAFETAKNYYMSWQGTYSSAFLVSLHPGIFSERLYILTTPIMLFALISSNAFLFWVLFTFYLPLKKELRTILTLSVLFLSIQILDSGASAFYWFNGAFHYVFMHSCMIFLIALLLLFLKASKKRTQFLCLFFASFLSFITEGANYVTVLLTPILIALLIFICLLYKNKKGLWCLFPFFVALAGFIFNISASGNSVRMAAQADSMGAFEAIYHSFIFALEGIGNWTTLYVLFFLLLVSPFLFSALYKIKFHFPFPGLIAGVSFCLIAASYTPSLYSMGYVIIFERTLNIMRMFYYLLLFLNLTYLIGWLTEQCHKYCPSFDFLTLTQQLKTNFIRSFSLTMAAFFFCLLLFSDKNKVTSLSAIHSLQKGYAQSYHAESLNRTALLSMDGVDEVWVPNFSVCPPLLDPQILSTDPNEYPNPTIARYYGKKILHLSIIY